MGHRLVTDQGCFIGVRPFTFFEKGVVGHVGFADPFDERIAKVKQENTIRYTLEAYF